MAPNIFLPLNPNLDVDPLTANKKTILEDELIKKLVANVQAQLINHELNKNTGYNASAYSRFGGIHQEFLKFMLCVADMVKGF